MWPCLYGIHSFTELLSEYYTILWSFPWLFASNYKHFSMFSSSELLFLGAVEHNCWYIIFSKPFKNSNRQEPLNDGCYLWAKWWKWGHFHFSMCNFLCCLFLNHTHKLFYYYYYLNKKRPCFLQKISQKGGPLPFNIVGRSLNRKPGF